MNYFSDNKKEDLIKSEGRCYFSFCVYDDNGILRVNRNNCIIGKKCKPFVDWCKDGKKAFQYPFTYTYPSQIVKLAYEYKDNSY